MHRTPEEPLAEMFQFTSFQVACSRGSLLLALVACGHSETARKPDEAPTVEPPVATPAPPPAAAAASAPAVEPPAAAPALSPAASATPAPSPVAAAAKPVKPAPAPDHDYIAALMSEHFLITIWARDAVIEGNVEGLRAPLRALAQFHYPASVPSSWGGSLSRLQEAARQSSEARTLDAAAMGVAAMARVCGDCHLETSGQAKLGKTPVQAATPPSDTLAKRMSRHIWAVDRMWVGLTGPSDDAWNAGAAALAHAPAKMKGAKTVLPGDFQASLREVRALGASAQSAKTSEERAKVYGRALATCAYCHAFGAEAEF